jgi:hypothetical protein
LTGFIFTTHTVLSANSLVTASRGGIELMLPAPRTRQRRPSWVALGYSVVVAGDARLHPDFAGEAGEQEAIDQGVREHPRHEASVGACREAVGRHTGTARVAEVDEDFLEEPEAADRRHGAIPERLGPLVAAGGSALRLADGLGPGLDLLVHRAAKSAHELDALLDRRGCPGGRLFPDSSELGLRLLG